VLAFAQLDHHRRYPHNNGLVGLTWGWEISEDRFREWLALMWPEQVWFV